MPILYEMGQEAPATEEDDAIVITEEEMMAAGEDYRTEVQLCPTTGVWAQQMQECPNVKGSLMSSAVGGLTIGALVGGILGYWLRGRR